MLLKILSWLGERFIFLVLVVFFLVLVFLGFSAVSGEVLESCTDHDTWIDHGAASYVEGITPAGGYYQIPDHCQDPWILVELTCRKAAPWPVAIYCELGCSDSVCIGVDPHSDPTATTLSPTITPTYTATITPSITPTLTGTPPSPWP